MIKIKLKRERVEKWLKEQNEVLTIVRLERKLSFTRGTLSKHLSGKRSLTNNEIKKIDKYVQDSLDMYFDV